MYSDRFNSFINWILKWECDWKSRTDGELTRDKNDNGGTTRWGIDFTSYHKDHPDSSEDDIVNLTYEKALDIYWRDYWTKHNIESYSYGIGECLMNTFVNGGYPNEWLKSSGGDPTKYIDAQEQYYKDLCEYWKKKKKNEPYKYLPGWLNRTEDLRQYLKIS